MVLHGRSALQILIGSQVCLRVGDAPARFAAPARLLVSLFTFMAAGAAPLRCTTRSETPVLRLPDVEGAAHGFPVLRDTDGRKLADGEFTQWMEDGRLRIKIRYDFSNARRVEERASFRPQPELVQEEWSWSETKAGATER